MVLLAEIAFLNYKIYIIQFIKWFFDCVNFTQKSVRRVYTC